VNLAAKHYPRECRSATGSLRPKLPADRHSLAVLSPGKETAVPLCERGISVSGTERKCWNARVFRELVVDRLCYPPAGHSRA
jgi:hypothetical protein